MKRIYNYFKKKQKEVNSNHLVSKLIFIGLGISATIWFLFRVIPKPSRATYPCMQAVSPFMSAFVIYLISLWGGFTAFKKSKQYLLNRKIGLASLCMLAAIVSMVAFTSNNIKTTLAQVVKKEKAVMMLDRKSTRLNSSH